jgi:hypothetical protein
MERARRETTPAVLMCMYGPLFIGRVTKNQLARTRKLIDVWRCRDVSKLLHNMEELAGTQAGIPQH